MTTNFARYAILALTFLVAGTHAPASAQTQKVRVFVETHEGGDAAELADRETSVKDLAAALASRKKMFTVVDDESNADIRIFVVERAYNTPKVVFGLGARPGQSTIGTGPVRSAELRVRVTRVSSDLAVDLKNKNKAMDNPRGWKSAADDLAAQIEKWVFEQRGRRL